MSRRSLLTAAGGAALVLVPVRPALGATDDELAYANFAVSSELLLADLYEKALGGKALSGTSQSVMRAGRRAALQHARALSALLEGAGQDAPAADDFAFRWPKDAFATRAAVATTARRVLRALLGVYQTAVATVSEPSYRVVYASLAASVGQQLGALTALAAGSVVEAFPVAHDLERASAAVDAYLG